jgi:hypothetical protein
MFTFCFMSFAGRNFRSVRKVLNSARRSHRAVRSALAMAAVLTAAGLTQAGSPSSHSMGSSGGNNVNRGNTTFSLGSKFSTIGNTPKVDAQKPTILNSQNNILHNTTLPLINTNINTIKINKLPIDNKHLDSNVKVDPKLVKNDKFFDKKLIDKKFVDKCHDKKFHCCPWWYCWDYPVWCPLYGVGCGYWYNVPVVEIREGVDLQLLAVRMIDAGNPEQNMGPAFRVWIRNNSPVAIVHGFNVLALAAHTNVATAELPQAGVRVETIGAGETLPLDIRLPVEANQPGLPMLHVLVDSHREIPEVFENNNGMVLPRANVLPIEEVAAN